MTPAKYKPFDAIPEEILLLIFSNFTGNPQELIKLMLVCRKWNRLAKDESLWRDVSKQYKAKTIPVSFLDELYIAESTLKPTHYQTSKALTIFSNNAKSWDIEGQTAKHKSIASSAAKYITTFSLIKGAALFLLILTVYSLYCGRIIQHINDVVGTVSRFSI